MKKRKSLRKRINLMRVKHYKNGLSPKFIETKKFVICGTVALLFLILCTLHAQAYMNNDYMLTFFDALTYVPAALSTHPFQFIAMPTGCSQYIAFSVLTFAMATLYIYTDEKRKEHIAPNLAYGTARFNDDLFGYNMKYSDPFEEPENNGQQNTIISQNIYLSMNTRCTRRNLNMIVIGGSGAGKSRFFIKPNLCMMPLNCNFVCTDPSGELLQDTGKMLEGNGFNLKVFNLVNMKMSDTYNPLKYIETENDVILLTDCILANTTDPTHKGGDDFWEKAQKLMFQAFIYLLWLHGDEVGLPRNFDSVMTLMRGSDISEEGQTRSGEEIESQTDKFFHMIEFGYKEDTDGSRIIGSKETSEKEGYFHAYGEDIAVKQYKAFKKGAGKTLKSILISAMARMSNFDSQDLVDLTSSDTIDLRSIAIKKTALFVIIPQEHESFNFLAAILYSQLFQTLYFYAENNCQGNYIVQDANGENVKIFEIDHAVKEDPQDENESAEEIDISNAVKNVSKKNIFVSFKEKRLYAKAKRTKRFYNKKVEKNRDTETLTSLAKENQDDLKASDEAALNEEQTRPKLDAGKEVDVVKKDAERYIERLKGARLIQKGSSYLVKLPSETEDQEDEIIGTYYFEDAAIKKFNAIKKCSIKRLGLFLPYHVRFLMDEFANIGQVPSFDKKLATMRKYEISASIVLQSLAQIKNMYKDNWGTIIGNCDSFLFLGCPENETCEFVSKRLGKTTITVRNNSTSYGAKGGSSLSYQKVGRELMLPEELQNLNDDECIYMLRGEYPFRTKKIVYEKCKNYQYTKDANNKNLYSLKIRHREEVKVQELSISSSEAMKKNIEEKGQKRNRLDKKPYTSNQQRNSSIIQNNGKSKINPNSFNKATSSYAMSNTIESIAKEMVAGECGKPRTPSINDMKSFFSTTTTLDPKHLFGNMYSSELADDTSAINNSNIKNKNVSHENSENINDEENNLGIYDLFANAGSSGEKPINKLDVNPNAANDAGSIPTSPNSGSSTAYL